MLFSFFANGISNTFTKYKLILRLLFMHQPFFVLRKLFLFQSFNFKLNEYTDRYITSAAVTLKKYVSMDGGNFISAFVSARKTMKQKETVVYGYLVFKIAEATKCFCPFISFALKLCWLIMIILLGIILQSIVIR